MSSNNSQDEADFWQDMITLWETNNQGPVPKRMREALELAKSKYKVAKDAFLSKSWWKH